MAIHGEKKKKKKPANMTVDLVDNDKSWEIERDLESLCRAEAVKKDPVRMEKCKKLAADKLSESKRRRDEAQTMIDMGYEGEHQK